MIKDHRRAGSSVDTSMTNDEIRAEVSALLSGLATGRVSRMGAGSDDIDAAREYLRVLAPGGWAVPAWPGEFGGRTASAEDTARIRDILAELPKPDLYPFQVGLDLVGPSLLVHGTEEQNRRWLPRIADGSQIWCQMFSEPSAGSDLANVATRARRDGRDGDGRDWVMTGQKVWTSRGAYAIWGICLARTDPDLPKHQGLTAFAVRMDAPGVTVRMLRQMNGDQHFSEVFLEDVRVSDADRIGAVGEGWKVALTMLANERTGLKDDGRIAHPHGAAPAWLADLAAAGALDDDLLLDRAIRVYVEECVVEMMRARAAAHVRVGKAPGPEGSGQKLRAAAVFRQRAELIKDAQGLDGLLSTTPGNVEFLTAPSMSIRGGTDEIQRTIIGERVLGLEREPRVDREGPWSQTRSGS
jgi:alkylation response protein AidB-like acyl-CoA dehydrogenase